MLSCLAGTLILLNFASEPVVDQSLLPKDKKLVWHPIYHSYLLPVFTDTLS